jgi:hypothetical protein
VRRLFCSLLLVVACDRGGPSQPSGASAPSGSASVAAAPSSAPRAPKQTPLPNERVEIPTGAFQAGSIPGEAGRNPELEPRLTKLELGRFHIDRLPYPNDPQKPALTGVSWEEARKLCAERAARLCTELEWERACKGPASEPYPTGATFNPRCTEEPASCASGFDVLGMGTGLAEWTASDLGERAGKRSAVTRGAGPKAPAEAHRCAARVPTPIDSEKDDLGFRCCWGAPNARAIPEAKSGETFRKAKLPAERIAALLASSKLTEALAKDVKLFRDPDSAETVVSRGPGERKGFDFTVAPLLWNPVPGAEFLLVSARSGESTSFVLAFYVRGDDDYALASSFVMKDEPGPVAFAYSNDIRPRLHFSTCWGCPGETGKILFRQPEKVVIVQP